MPGGANGTPRSAGYRRFLLALQIGQAPANVLKLLLKGFCLLLEELRLLF